MAAGRSAERGHHKRGWPERWRLPVAPAALVVLATAVTLLGAAGVLPRWPGLIHLVALPPLDLIADLRMLMVNSPSYPVFALGVACSLAVRITVLGFLLGGPDRRLLAFAARYYLAVLPAALLAAALPLGSGATLYFGLFWIGMIVTLVTVALTAAPWQAPPRLARSFAEALRHGLRLGSVGGYLGALAALGAVADLTGPAGAVALVPLSAALALAAVWLLRADLGFRIARRSLAAATATLLAALAAVVATGPASPPRAPEPAAPRGGSLMLMSGVDSASGNGAILEIDPHRLGYGCAQTYYFSYAGPGDGQPRNNALCPVTTGAPYQPQDTLRPTDRLIAALEAQVADLPPPVVLVTHSQGVWIVWEAAARGRLPHVEVIVLIGPFPDNPVPYPPEGEQGISKPAAGVTWLVSHLPRPGGGTSVFAPDVPLGREWLAHPTAIERTLAKPLPGNVRALAVPSVFDLPLTPAGSSLRSAQLCPIPVIHPNLPYSTEFHDGLVGHLDRRPPPRCPLWRHAVGSAFRPFATPAWDA